MTGRGHSEDPLVHPIPASDRDLTGKALRWQALRLGGGGASSGPVDIVVEEPLDVTLNGQLVATLMRLPGDERELAAGFCVSEGLVPSFSDILTVSHCELLDAENPGVNSPNRVDVSSSAETLRTALWSTQIRSGCGRLDAGALNLTSVTPVSSTVEVPAGELLALAGRLRDEPRLYAQTGGVHAAALFSGTGDLVVAREDVGRHNAVDKIIGYALMRRIDLGALVIVTTGRASHEMVMKTVRVGAPVLASASSATSLAVALAERLNLTLVGYLRAGRATVYTHPERILGG